jgi:hypothetical protein
MNSEWWVNFISKIGIPSAIAVYLTYNLTNTFTTSINTIKDNQVVFSEQLRLHAVDNSYILKETNQMRVVLQQICANTATTREDRNGCFK